ncbi:MAG TPA: holo-ACP synthase [Solirubrobacteraceae bacterium]|nr:holo-ACP synthase [Solirubrobacteraceae bacterium]
MSGGGIGLDLLEIERIERALARRPNLAGRLFHPGELEYSRGRARPGQHLAARFCAKEAVSKALGMSVFAPLDVEVLRGGAEVGIALHGAAAARAGELGVEVGLSMTHTRGMAAAVAILR